MPPPIWPAPTTRTCGKLTRLAYVPLARELVQLGADEEDRRRDEDVRREDEEDGQASRRALQVRDLCDPPAKERRGDDPCADDEERAAARPAELRLLGGREAEEKRHRRPEEEDRDRPAKDAEQGVERAVRNGRGD